MDRHTHSPSHHTASQPRQARLSGGMWAAAGAGLGMHHHHMCVVLLKPTTTMMPDARRSCRVSMPRCLPAPPKTQTNRSNPSPHDPIHTGARRRASGRRAGPGRDARPVIRSNLKSFSLARSIIKHGRLPQAGAHLVAPLGDAAQHGHVPHRARAHPDHHGQGMFVVGGGSLLKFRSFCDALLLLSSHVIVAPGEST